MSSSAIRRKSYKKAQEEARPYSPVHWEADGGSGGGDGDGSEVPAGKLQVMEKFFTPVEKAKERKGPSDLAPRDCRRRPQWMESRSDRFSALSSSTSSASTSSSSASWSSEASLDKEAFLMTNPRYHHHPQHSQSCVDVSGEAQAFRHSREEAKATYAGSEDAAPSFVRLRKGQSKSVDRLSHHRPGPRELPSLSGPADGVDRQLYKATSLERSLVFNEEAEILAPRQSHQTGASGPSKGILKNGAVTGGDRLRKAKSIETITVRAPGKEPRAPGLGPTRPLQRERQPPNSLDLSGPPKKSPVTERMRRMEEKLRFSEFLNEITQQVMSPSSLSSLGWKPPESASAGKAPSTDESDSKGSGSKTSSPGSLLEMVDGKVETASRGRKRSGLSESKGEAALARHSRHQSRTTDEASTSPEMGSVPHLPTHLGSLPKLSSAEPGKSPRKPSEAASGHSAEAGNQEQPPKKGEKDATGAAAAAEKPNVREAQGSVAGKARTPSQELLTEANAEQLLSPQEQTTSTSPAEKEEADIKSRSAQRDLQKTWEELENLKEKFSRLQEDYSGTRLTNQLLEEKLQIIAQSMAEERQTLNRRINELLERLISAQNTICALEKVNISGLVSKSVAKHQRVEKSESPDSLCSLHNLEVAPPPAFMDGASDARTTPSQSDSATEAGKPGGSSESDTAGPDGERPSLVEYRPLVASSEGLKRHGKGHARVTAFTPWKQKSTRFSTEPVNSTESECSGEEMTPICPFPTPRFLYLRQETLVAPTGPGSFPPLPAAEPVAFDAGRPASPTGLPPSGQLELVPELSSSESSEDDGEVSWSPGLVEKTSSNHLDYESAQKMLDSLLHKNPEQEKSREKEAHKTGRPGGYRVAGYKEGNASGLGVGRHHRHHHQQHRIRYYQDFSSPGEELPDGKSCACPPTHGMGSLPRGVKGVAAGLDGDEAAQDSTSL